MSGYNGAGAWTRSFLWATDDSSGVKILASRQDTEWANVISGFNTAFCRDGQALATGNFNMAGFGITNYFSDGQKTSVASIQDALNQVTEFPIGFSLNIVAGLTFVSATVFTLTGNTTATFVP